MKRNPTPGSSSANTSGRRHTPRRRKLGDRLSRARLSLETLEQRNLLAVWTGGGDGTTWSNAANWDNGNVPGVIANEPAIFQNDLGNVTINVDGNYTLGALQFTNTAGSYTLQNNSLTPTSVSHSGAAANTVRSLLAGGGGVTISGGTLTLQPTAANTYSGGTVVSAGTLLVGTTGGLGSGAVTMNSGSTGASNTSLLASQPVTINNNITVANAGTGTTTLGSTNFIAGANTQFGGSITLQKGVTFQAGSSDRTTIAGVISGTGDVTITSPFANNRRIVFDRPSGAANTFNGDIYIGANAYLQLGVANSIGNRTVPDDADIYFAAGAALRPAPAAGADSERVGGLISQAPGAGTIEQFTGGVFTLEFGGGDAAGNFSGNIINTSAAQTLGIRKVGTGTQILGGAGNARGGMVVNGGTLRLEGNRGFNAGYFTDVDNVPYTVQTGATLELAGDWISRSNSVYNIHGGTIHANAPGGNLLYINQLNFDVAPGQITGGFGIRSGYFFDPTYTVTAAASGSAINAFVGLFDQGAVTNNLTINVANGANAVDLSINQGLSDDAAFPGLNVIKTGAGAMTLAGSGTTNNTSVGLLHVQQGELNVGPGFAGDGAWKGNVTIDSGATLRMLQDNIFANGSDFTINGTLDMNGRTDVIGNLQGGGTIINNTNGTGIVLDDLSGTRVYSGNISGNGALQTRGAVDSTGTQVLSGGTYQFNAINLGRGTVSFTNNPTVTVSGNVNVGENNIVQATTGSLSATLNIDSGSLTASGIQFGNTAFGGTGRNIPVIGVLNQSGGTVTTTGNPGDGNGIRLGHWPTGQGTYNLSNGVLNVNNNFELSTATDGTGAFIQTGGTANVRGVDVNSRNNATGNGTFTLNGGTFNLGAGGIVRDNASAPYTINLGGGTLRATADFGSILNINVTNAVGPAVIDTNGFNVSLTGVLSGAGALRKAGTGNLTLSNAANSYGGGTVISQGTILLAHPDALGGGTVTLNDANTGAADNALLATFADAGNSIANNFVVANFGTGTSTIGTTVFNSGAVPTLFDGTLTLNKATTLQGGNSDRTSYTGVISGNVGLLTVSGGARTTWETDNTFVGDVALVDNGTILQIGRFSSPGNQIPDASNVSVGSGAILQLVYDDETINGLSGSGTVRPFSGLGDRLLVVGSTGGGGNFSGSLVTNGGSRMSLTKVGGGTQTISGGNSELFNLIIEQGGITFSGNAVMNVINNVGVGRTGTGTLNVQDTVQLTIGNELNVGDQNGFVGNVNQSGGTVTINNRIRNAHWPNNISTYTLSGGSLNVTNAINVGWDGIGIFNQTGGATTAGQIIVDGNGNTGPIGGQQETFTITGGTLNAADLIVRGGIGNIGGNANVQISNTVRVGQVSASTLNVSGTATLAMGGEFLIGDANGVAGTVTQTGGTVNVGDRIRNAHWPANISTYNLSGGALNVTNAINVGWDGVGIFNQTGGTTTAAQVIVDGNGNTGPIGGQEETLNITGGSLSTTDLIIRGGVGIIGGNASVQVGNTVRVGQVSASTLTIGGTAMLSMNGEFLIGDANGVAGTVNQTGGTVNVGDRIRQAHYPANVSSYNLSGGALNVTNALNVGWDGIGIFNQSGGTTTAAQVIVDGNGNTGPIGSQEETLNITGGSLTTSSLLIRGGVGIIGGNATVQVNGSVGVGQVSASSLTISGTATLNMTGELNIGDANGVPGTVTQTGGTVNIGDRIRNAHWPNNISTYNLSGGALNVTNDINVGWDGIGVFTQTGGTATAANLVIDMQGLTAPINGQEDTVTLSAGTFNVNNNILISGGILNIAGTAQVNVGGTIDMGARAAGRPGELNQSGGLLTVAGAGSSEDAAIRIGHWPNQTSTYNLSAGELRITHPTAGIALATDGSGNFNMTGGTASSPIVTVNHRNANGTGNFTLAGGTFNLGAGGFQTQGASYSINLGGGSDPVLNATANWNSALPATLAGSGTSAITIDTNGFNVGLSGVLSGSGGLNKTGAGTLTLANAASTFSGDLSIDEGQVNATVGHNDTNPNSALGHPSTPGRQIVVGTGTTLAFGANDVLGNAAANPSTAIVVNGGTVTNSGNFFNTLGPLTLSGGLLTAIGGANTNYQAYRLAGTVTVAGATPSTIATSGPNSGVHLVASTTFDVADVTSSSAADLIVNAVLLNQSPLNGNAPAGLTKTGAGTLVLNAANLYTGATNVNAGTLAGDGSVNSNVSVAAGATLSPGGTPGDFATAGVTFNTGSFFEVQLAGADPGTGYDQLIASSVNLGGATLVVTSTATTTPGQIFRIIRNDGAAPTTGAFAGLPDGSTLLINGEKFFITYNDPANRYGTGNDVALIRNQGVIAVDDDFGPTLVGIAIEGNVKDNDIDPDGDGVVQLVNGPANGTLQIIDAATGEFVYTPNPNFIGTDTFTYRLSDGEFTSDEATVTITVAQFVEQDGNLYVAGTNGSDRIIVQSHSGGGVGIRMNNTLYGPFDASHVVVFGYRGNDTITVSGRVPVTVAFFGGEGNDYLAGGNEDDTLDGGAGNDRILGANGDDLLYGGPGSDRFSGGNGNDTAFGDSYLEVFDTALNGDLSTLIGEAVESDPSESGRDTVNGDGGDDFLYGEGNNDTINGGHGNDFLRGGEGNDRLSGGNGDDLLIGDDGADLLSGQNGRDVLFGGDGSDTLNGGSADDLLYGGMFFDDSDETLMATAQFWFDFDDEGAVFDLESNAEDDGVGDLLNGERDADYYVLWFLDRIRLTSETRSPNRSLDLSSNP